MAYQQQTREIAFRFSKVRRDDALRTRVTDAHQVLRICYHSTRSLTSLDDMFGLLFLLGFDTIVGASRRGMAHQNGQKEQKYVEISSHRVQKYKKELNYYYAGVDFLNNWQMYFPMKNHIKESTTERLRWSTSLTHRDALLGMQALAIRTASGASLRIEDISPRCAISRDCKTTRSECWHPCALLIFRRCLP